MKTLSDDDFNEKTTELVKSIRETVIDFNEKNFPELKEIVLSRETNLNSLYVVSTCAEIILRALAFMLGFSKSSIRMMPKRNIERIIVDELCLGEEAFNNTIDSLNVCSANIDKNAN